MNFCVGWMGILKKRPFISYTTLDEHPPPRHGDSSDRNDEEE